jgi:hypothetical protein
VLRRYFETIFWSGEWIAICSRFGIDEKARIKEGIFVAAWKIGGY